MKIRGLPTVCIPWARNYVGAELLRIRRVIRSVFGILLYQGAAKSLFLCFLEAKLRKIEKIFYPKDDYFISYVKKYIPLREIF